MKKNLLKAFTWGSVFTMSAVSLAGCGTNDANNETDTNTNVDLTKYENGETKPNVIYIVLDDIGFSDLGAYGSEIKTPNIDALAANGLTYNNFNACPLSSITRASLLTGRESNSVGMGNVANVSLSEDLTNLQGRVKDEAGMISEVLNQSGYATFGVGKWHLAPAYQVNPAGPFDNWPLQKGFDRYYGFMDGETDQYSPQLVSGNELIDSPDTEGYTLNDDLLTHAEQYITDQVSMYPDTPFFLNYAFGTGHSPVQVPESYIDMYDGTYDAGWEAVRQARFEKQKELGIIPEDAELADFEEGVQDWASLTADEQKLFARFMETYAGYITQADEEVGKLVQHLKDLGVYENTMIVLIGDNGATGDGGLLGTDAFIGGMTAGIYPEIEYLLEKYDEIGTADMQSLYQKGWAQVSNTPFGHFKGSTYAGALRNPMIVSWPSGISDVGTIREQYISVTDITPTVLDILEIDVPETINGVTQMPMYGVSFASTFESSDAEEVRTVAPVYFQNYRSIFKDGWQAIGIHTPGTDWEDDTWELYNLNEDFSQVNNVAEDNADKLKELKKLFDEETADWGIYPLREGSPFDMGFLRDDSPANRTTFKYYNGVGHMSPGSFAPIQANNAVITVDITRDAGEQGVLLAKGDEIGGYSLYIKDNKLVYYYDRYGLVSKVVSNIDVPIGESEIKLEIVRANVFASHAILYINGVNVGEGDISEAPVVSLEGVDVGKDMYKPVSPEYAEFGDFEFTGDFDYITIEVTPLG